MFHIAHLIRYYKIIKYRILLFIVIFDTHTHAYMYIYIYIGRNTLTQT